MSAADILARYLRQRQELGETELILEDARVTTSLEADSRAPGPGAEARRGAASRPVVPARVDGPGPRPSAPAPAADRGAASAAIPFRPDPPAPTAPAFAGSATGPLVSIGEWDELRASAMACTACGLAGTRTHVVFGEGDPAADLVVVGEAPGADEDRTGRPFVGRAGKLLDQLLLSIGLPRDRVYICNVLKCRPPQNRNPRPEEVAACGHFLRAQLTYVAPKAILAIGTFPAQALLETTQPIGRLRGGVHAYEGVPLVPTYHPAALLRNSTWIRPVWEDLQRLRSILDG